MPTALRSATARPGEVSASVQADLSAILGVWEWELDLGVSSGKALMEVTEKEGTLNAVVTTPDGVKIKSKDFRVENGKVSFSVERKKGFLNVRLQHRGILKADEIQGTFTAKGGPIKKEGKWQATRVENKPSEEEAHVWK